MPNFDFNSSRGAGTSTPIASVSYFCLLLPPPIPQAHRQIEHRLAWCVIDPVRHKVADPFKLELVVGLGAGRLIAVKAAQVGLPVRQAGTSFMSAITQNGLVRWRRDLWVKK